MVLFVGRSVLIYRGFCIVFMCVYGCVHTYVFVSACAHTRARVHMPVHMAVEEGECPRHPALSLATYFLKTGSLIEPGIHYVSTRLARRPTYLQP